MSLFASKLPHVGVSIFTQMTSLSNAAGAINLSQGFPDFEPDSLLLEGLAFYSQNGRNQYAPAAGVLELREALAKKYPYHPAHEITITSGASEALYVAITTVVKPGDEVIIIEPAYDLYVPVVKMQGGIPVYVSTHFPTYTIDWEKVESAINDKTRLIILNNPHNPTGKTLRIADIQALEKLAEAHPQLFIISDEVYEHIVFEGYEHYSLSQSEILKQRTFICSSFAKTYHITGWKIGYCLAPQILTEEFRKIHQYVTFCSFTPAQYALADFILQTDVQDKLGQFYQEKRDFFKGLIEQVGFTFLESEGSFFQNVSYEGISDQNDTAFCKDLVQQVGVAAIPISAFYHDATDHKVIRFCFAKSANTLEAAAERLQKIEQFW